MASPGAFYVPIVEFACEACGAGHNTLVLMRMGIELYLTFVAATVALMAIPGPNVALIAATSITHGIRHGLMSVAGTTSAMIVQLALVGAGLNGFLLLMSDWFEVLRWCGALYLVLLGITIWRSKPSSVNSHKPEPQSHQIMFLRGIFVSLTNPKTLLFYGAFFPQFIAPEGDALKQVLLLAATFIVIAIIIDSIWALTAARLRTSKLIANRFHNRLAGGVLIGAGVGLALARKT
ncbi:MAG: LysE family translocator [Alphaproteobacteria bacterium]